jgi:hypothetical protein
MYHRSRFPSSEYHPSNFNDLVFNDKYERGLHRVNVLCFSLNSHFHTFLSILSMGSRISLWQRISHHWNKKARRGPVGRHDREASTSRCHCHLSRVEKEVNYFKEHFWVHYSGDKIWSVESIEDRVLSQQRVTREGEVIKEETKWVADPVNLRTRDT